jgi:hypothetical protein
MHGEHALLRTAKPPPRVQIRRRLHSLLNALEDSCGESTTSAGAADLIVAAQQLPAGSNQRLRVQVNEREVSLLRGQFFVLADRKEEAGG